MKIAPICLLTGCKRRKFKLFRNSSQVRAIDNRITCCYLSASLSNRLRALKAHSSLFKCCEKNCPNYMYWIQGKYCGSWFWVFLRLFVSLKLIFIVPFNFQSISIYFSNSRGRVPLATNSPGAKKWHWHVQKVTLAGPKSHTRAKMSYWSVINDSTQPNGLNTKGDLLIIIVSVRRIKGLLYHKCTPAPNTSDNCDNCQKYTLLYIVHAENIEH